MKYLKNLGKSLLYIFSITIISTLFFTFLNFINLINSNILSILELIIILISTFVGGFYLGKKAKKNGWLEGIKLSIIIILFLFILNTFIFNNKIQANVFIYYFIILISTTLGSMFGITKKTS